jgi:hypothetical protein
MIRWVAPLLLAIGGHYLSNLIGVIAMREVAGIACQNRGPFLACSYPQDVDYSILLYAALAAGFALTALSLRLFWRDKAIFLFGCLWVSLGGAAVLFDLVSGQGILAHNRVVNSAYDLLSAGLFAGLLLVPMITIGRKLSILSFTVAVLITMCMKIAALVGFALFEPLMRGALELWFLYCVFIFAAFNAHIMAVSTALLDLDNRGRQGELREEARVSR